MRLERIAINVNRKKPGANELEKELLTILWDNDVSVFSLEKVTTGEAKADAVFLIGGDGTVLSTVSKVVNLEIPILGINIGKLGFLTELLPDELDNAIPKIVQGEFEIRKRMMIICEHTGGSSLALNEAVIDKAGSPRGIFIRIEISGIELGYYFADGLIISTPTGSTAYSMSAGGAIVSPDMEAILLTPICPYTLAIRPVVIGADEVVGVTFESSPLEELPSLTIDGQKRFMLKKNEKIIIRKYDKKALFITYHKRPFYEILRKKLGWGSQPISLEEK